MTTTLRTLLDRVEKGEGSDREIDALLDAAFDPRPGGFAEYGGKYDRAKLIARRDGYVQVGRGGPSWCSPVYTSSIDAAVYLVVKVMPGYDHGYNTSDGIAFGTVWRAGYLDDTVMRGEARTPARAIVAALLRAKIAQEEGA